MKFLSPLAFVALTIPTISFAGPQYIDRTGYAASGYDVVAYFELKQNKIGQKQPKAIPGKADITAEHNGAKWAFSSEKNRDLFLKNPEAYIPQYDGHCAYGVAVGNKVPANPNLWRIVDGKLYLNITSDVNRAWERNVPRHISRATRNWGYLEKRGAAGRTIPQFRSKAPQS